MDLLKQVGLTFETIAPTSDETPHRGEKPDALVKRLAFDKARSVREKVLGPAIIIAADTIVVSPNGKTILGKPKDRSEAEKTLKSLVGKTHTVLTGYCILVREAGEAEKKRIRRVKSQVKMRALSPREITRYVNSGEPMDKAGAYAAQGIGTALVESLRGSYTNVVGLPIAQLLLDLEQMVGCEFIEWLDHVRKN
jgi:septum formation protein